MFSKCIGIVNLIMAGLMLGVILDPPSVGDMSDFLLWVGLVVLNLVIGIYLTGVFEESEYA